MWFAVSLIDFMGLSRDCFAFFVITEGKLVDEFTTIELLINSQKDTSFPFPTSTGTVKFIANDSLLSVILLL